MKKTSINSIYDNLSAPTAGFAAVCLTGEVQECLQSQETTGRAWIGLEQNIIDAAVNEWRKRLLACGQLNEMSAKVSET